MKSRIVRVRDIPGNLPPLHYDMDSRRLLGDAEVRSFKISYVTLFPNGRSDVHVHKGVEQFYLVLKGEMGVDIEGQQLRLGPSEAILVRPDEKHRNYNVSAGETEYLVVTGNRSAADA